MNNRPLYKAVMTRTRGYEFEAVINFSVRNYLIDDRTKRQALSGKTDGQYKSGHPTSVGIPNWT